MKYKIIKQNRIEIIYGILLILKNLKKLSQLEIKIFIKKLFQK